LTSPYKASNLFAVPTASTLQLHASCVQVAGIGVLLCGASGSGKSDLALRMIQTEARLIADDRVDLTREDGDLVARCPRPIQGLLEVRGVGIVRVETQASAKIGLAIDLVGREQVDRLPAARTRDYLGVAVPVLALDPFEFSAAAKVAIAARQTAAGALFAV
jgi:HPr kinase/phosphorylase